MKKHYSIDYQYKACSGHRPLAHGNVIRTSAEETPAILIPAVGDFVEISGNPTNDSELTSFSGIVISRLFRYARQSDSEVFCHINIVVEESLQDFVSLVNE